jgi:hypothetical protein
MKNKNTLRNEINELKATLKNELNPNEPNKNHIFNRELQKQILKDEGYDIENFDKDLDKQPHNITFSKEAQLKILENEGYK